MATILDPPITEDLLFYLNLYYNLSSEFGVSLSNGTQGSSVSPFLLWPLDTLPMLPTIHCFGAACMRLLQPRGLSSRGKEGEISGGPWLATSPSHLPPPLHGQRH